MSVARRKIYVGGYFYLNHYAWDVDRPAPWVPDWQRLMVWVEVDKDVPMSSTVYQDRARTQRLGSASRGEFSPLLRARSTT